MDCRGCRYYHNLADNHCFACDGSGYTRPSNADRIRAMTDEELAEFMCHSVSPSGTVNCSSCEAQGFCRMGHNGWLDWLRQEASDGVQG